jgi:hypothetical protein
MEESHVHTTNSWITYLAATIACVQTLSGIMPTFVVSSSATVGMLNAFGRRARQFDLFSSSNVYRILTTGKSLATPYIKGTLQKHDSGITSHYPAWNVAKTAVFGGRAHGYKLHATMPPWLKWRRHTWSLRAILASRQQA